MDSRKLLVGDLFFAIKGDKSDGRQYINDVISKGAAAVLAEGKEETISWQHNVAIITLPNLQQKIGELAARFYDHPAQKMRMLGVTGTSGKTSCTYFLAQVLDREHLPCGLIGTLGSGFYHDLKNVALTTPDAITLQQKLKNFLQNGAKAIAMEVSSHSIAQGRINGIDYDVGIFTNLSQDHLDYHGDMQTYAQVKHHYLQSSATKNIVLNLDDAYAQTWLKPLSKLKNVITYSTQNKSATIFADQIQCESLQIKAQIATPWGKGALMLPLVGSFNLSNSLSVIGALALLDLPLTRILHHLKTISPVPGRMELIGGGDKPAVIVDYAHKPDALEKVLIALRQQHRGKLICVFGCGGERDRTKRPLMGAIAARLSDQVIITNDNPRHEDPEWIAQEILQGISKPKDVILELNRSKAIEKSIQLAGMGDCILIAGKGAEKYQQIGDQKYPFDDVAEVKNFLNKST